MADKPTTHEGDTETIIEEEIFTKEPNMYQVILLNDDYTPMDFVIWLVQKVFHKNLEESTHLMLQVHQKGRGICGVFPFDVAQTKVYQAKSLAKKHEHPLECVMESVGQ